jgi:hypothetical protein
MASETKHPQDKISSRTKHPGGKKFTQEEKRPDTKNLSVKFFTTYLFAITVEGGPRK